MHSALILRGRSPHQRIDGRRFEPDAVFAACAGDKQPGSGLFERSQLHAATHQIRNVLREPLKGVHRVILESDHDLALASSDGMRKLGVKAV